MVPIPHPEPTTTTASSDAVDTFMADNDNNNTALSPPPIQDPSTQQKTSKKRKRKTIQKPHIIHQCTFRRPTWTYLHLCLVTPGTASSSLLPHTRPTSNISPLLVSTLLTPPLTAYLGITGAAIPIDILKTSGREVWMRVPRQDARALRASLSGWVGSCEGADVPGLEGGGKVKVAWRVVGEAGTLLGVVGGDGREVFGG